MIHRFSKNSDSLGYKRPDLNYVDNRSDMEQKHPLIQMNDDSNNDIAYAIRISQEIIHISGADVNIYLRTNNYYDDVFGEDADPTYVSSKSIKGFFVPKTIESKMTEFGVDNPNDLEIIFSRPEVNELFGDRMIRVGDLIDVPYNAVSIKPDRYRVTNAFDSGNFRYTWLYFTCHCESITGDDSIDVDYK